MALDFLKKRFVGVYFGLKEISVVQQDSSNIVNSLSVPYPCFESDSEVSSRDIFDIFKNKDVELVAFLQKVIRDSKLDASDFVVALPSKDLIVRFFEIPNIPKSEILAGITFEMKKYIPFKIEELAYDFQYKIKNKANIIEVILCGMKQGSLDKYIDLFRQLKINVTAFEPGLFSLFRLLVFRNKILNERAYIVLEFDKEDANILIIENKFPYFTRDIKIVFKKTNTTVEADLDVVLFRLINEIRVSLDYYKRQFMKKDVDELIIVADKVYNGWVDSFSKELGLKVNFITFPDLLKLKDAREEAMPGFAASFGAALKIQRPSLVTLNLGKSREAVGKISLLGGISGDSLTEPILQLIRDTHEGFKRGIVIGVVILVVTYGMGFSKLFPLEKDYAIALIKQPPLLLNVDLSSLETIQSSETAYSEKARDYRKIIKEYSPVYKKIVIFSKIFLDGIWLSSFSYTNNPPTFDLNYFSYADNEKLRFSNMNKFIAELEQNKNFLNEMPSIELKSYKEVSVRDFLCLQFNVYCKKEK